MMLMVDSAAFGEFATASKAIQRPSQSTADYESATNDHDSIAETNVFRAGNYKVRPHEIHSHKTAHKQCGPSHKRADNN
jgi:hypothetical protein